MEIKQPITFLERIQNSYQEYPQPFWILMAGTFIDRLGTSLIIPFLAIYVSRGWRGHGPVCPALGLVRV